MSHLIKYLSSWVTLTILKKCVGFLVLQLNSPIVPKRGVLPMALKKGIITLTLVISREFVRPPVTRWLCVMNFKFLQVKTKLQTQVGDYITSKNNKGVNVDISGFMKFFRLKNSIEEISLDNLREYYNHVKATENAKFFVNLAIKDARVMYRWFKARKYNVVEPNLITEEGLTIEIKDDIMDPMIQKKAKIGRPPKIELIKTVKTLREIDPKTEKPKFSYRAISRIIKKDVSQVHVWDNYDLKE